MSKIFWPNAELLFLTKPSGSGARNSDPTNQISMLLFCSECVTEEILVASSGVTGVGSVPSTRRT